MSSPPATTYCSPSPGDRGWPHCTPRSNGCEATASAPTGASPISSGTPRPAERPTPAWSAPTTARNSPPSRSRSAQRLSRSPARSPTWPGGHDDLAGSVAGRRILDVGCGTGPVLEALRDRGAIVTGVEPSIRFSSSRSSRITMRQAASMGVPWSTSSRARATMRSR
ncbi:class I SAM-dependent methyltransferase [Streptomyces sp. NBC_00557]|uniref:class I SAM-dependent methyltransferase n=1 Tax=Streptomyces sp. NBC_00557 TaxID=2975776 RepID=UPI003FCDD71F